MTLVPENADLPMGMISKRTGKIWVFRNQEADTDDLIG